MQLSDAIILMRNSNNEDKYSLFEFLEAICRLGFRITGNSRVRGVSSILAHIKSYLDSSNRESWTYENNNVKPSKRFKDRVENISRSTEPLINSQNRERVNELEDSLQYLLEIMDNDNSSVFQDIVRQLINPERTPHIAEMIYRPDRGPTASSITLMQANYGPQRGESRPQHEERRLQR